MFRTALLCAFVVLGLSTPAMSATVDALWGTNATSNTNIVDGLNSALPPTDRLRLKGGFTSGSIEGTVNLGFSDTWTILSSISNDQQFDIPQEYVEIRINNVLVATYYNTPLGAKQPFSHQITGDSFDYRFDFYSPITDFGSHLIVEAGTVTTEVVPLPAAGWLLLSGLGAMFVAGRRRRG